MVSTRPIAAHGAVASIPVPPPNGAKAGSPFGEADQRTLENEFSDTMHVSLADAAAAFSDSGPILDFNQAQTVDPGYGAIWVTYDSGYKVHVRYTSLKLAVSSDAVAALEQKLNRPIERHGGGASAAVLDRARRQLAGAKADFGIDAVSGVVETNVDPSQLGIPIESSLLRPRSPEPGIVAESTSGADIWEWPAGASGWARQCTAGFVIGAASANPQPRGFVTAGHCGPYSGASGYLQGTSIQQAATFAPLVRSCSTFDYEAIRSLSSPTDLDEFAFDKRTYPHPTINFQIAGGWYHGQPTLKAGLSTNGSIGSNTGIVGGSGTIDYGTTTRGPNGYCPNTDSVTGLRYDNLSQVGDSGGPIFLSYAGGWYLAATHVGGPAGGAPGLRLGTFVGDMALPPGWWICRSAQQC
jgi:hypothetical protein